MAVVGLTIRGALPLKNRLNKLAKLAWIGGTLFLPQFLKRRALRMCGYRIHPTARIGLSLILVDHLDLGAHSEIRHGVIIKNVSRVTLGEYSAIGPLNWVVAVPLNDLQHRDEPDRMTELYLGAHSAITSRHLIDCSNRVRIGKFTVIAGFRSQILTHSVNFREGRQRSQPVLIGDYCFIATSCVILPGSVLPDFCVLAAGAVLRKAFTDSWVVYGGIPAQPVSVIDPNDKFFSRSEGHVY